MKIETVSNKGVVKEINEDCYTIDDRLFYDARFHGKDCKQIFVCDGVSQCENGDKASRFVCDKLALDYKNMGMFQDKEIRAYFDNLNEQLIQMYDNAYTTVAGIIIRDSTLIVVNVGDSKVFRFRNGLIKQLSKDDTYYEYLKDIKDPNCELYANSHTITNCIGVSSFNSNNMHINEIEYGIMEKDIFVICSDGVSDMLNESKMLEIFEGKESLKNKLKAMEKEIIYQGALDNYTLVLLEV